MTTVTSISSVSFSFASSEVTQSSPLTISFTYPIPTEKNCFIEFIFPSEVPVSSPTSYNGQGFYNNLDTTTPFVLDPSFVTVSG